MSFYVRTQIDGLLTEVDDSSGETIELVVQQEDHRAMMPDHEYEEKQARLWKRRRKPGSIDVGDLIKVKGEMVERWRVRKVNVMKLGIPDPVKERG
jgi:hypothetical protein